MGETHRAKLGVDWGRSGSRMEGGSLGDGGTSAALQGKLKGGSTAYLCALKPVAWGEPEVDLGSKSLPRTTKPDKGFGNQKIRPIMPHRKTQT